jgi:hypothetical protein
MSTVKKKFQGRSPHRYKTDPLEKAFALAWQAENDTSRAGRRYSLMEYLFAENKDSSERPIANLTQRDWEIANTLIQWLGSHVGQCFLRDVLKRQTDSARAFRHDLIVESERKR